MKKTTKETLLQYGTIISALVVITVFIYFVIKYPPAIPLPVDERYPPIYSPYPGTELEHRLFLETRLLEYRRTA
mgnify:CR=1 FL=1